MESKLERRKTHHHSKRSHCPWGGCGYLEQYWGPWFYYEHSTVRTDSVEGEVGQQFLQKETSCKAQSNSYLLGYLEPFTCLKQLNFTKEGPVPLLEKEYETGRTEKGALRQVRGT